MKQNIYLVAFRMNRQTRKVKVAVNGFSDSAIDTIMETFSVPFEAIKGIRFLETV